METLLKKCSPNLLNIFVHAAQRALKEGKKSIDPDHLFFGLTHPEINQGHRPAKRTPKTRASKKTDAGKLRIASLDFSPLSARILSEAAQLADSYNHTFLGPEHLFISLLRSTHPRIKKILKTNNVDTLSLQHQLLSIVDHSTKILDLLQTVDPEHHGHEAHDHHHGAAPAPRRSPRTKSPSALEFFSINLTDKKNAATLDPVIGRDAEIDRLIRILARRTKNNPILVGPAGVGKTAIVEGLAKRIVSGAVPPYLSNKRIYSLDLASVIAGSAFRGEMEVRIKALIEDIRMDDNAILFIDEIHNLVGAGSSNGSLDVANILKPALARGELRCIGATTFEEYKRFIEDDPALERRFLPIIVKQPSAEETEEIIRGLLPYYENFHGVKILPDALRRAVQLTDRYCTDKNFPDKAIDVIDEASAQAKIDTASNCTITTAIITGVVSAMTGVPLSTLSTEEKTRYITLEQSLSRYIVGQDHVKKTVAQNFRRAYGGLREKGRPLASFLFLGPSGVGKTELSKVLAKELFGKNGLIKLDMSEFSESFSLARLIGAPSGYIGYKEGGRLTEGVRRNPHSLILFDEVEKAHPRVLNVLLQILDDGVLTDMAGKLVDFSNTAIILTSNIGSRAWNEGGVLGFSENAEKVSTAQKNRALGDLKQWFSVELLNRIDNILTFNPLEKNELRAIADLHLKHVQEKMRELNVTLKWGKNVIDGILEKNSSVPQGGRDIRRIIDDRIENILSEKLLLRADEQSLALTLSYKNGTFSCRS